MRINLYGGPNSGKSTFASEIYSTLKLNHKSVELVTETAKEWAYLNKTPSGFDQIYLMASQMLKEQDYLRNGVKIVVTDSPVLLAYIYADYYDLPCLSETLNIGLEYEERNPSFNVLMEIKKDNFNLQGRFQDLETSLIIHDKIKKLLEDYEINYVEESKFREYFKKDCWL